MFLIPYSRYLVIYSRTPSPEISVTSGGDSRAHKIYTSTSHCLQSGENILKHNKNGPKYSFKISLLIFILENQI